VKALSILALLLVVPVMCFGQDTLNRITSVNDVKKLMAETFEGIEDYTAGIRWKNGDTEYRGKIRYKKANKFLIEFDVPEDQTIVSNGEFLYLYIPYLKVVIQQSLKEATESTILTGTTEAGLSKLFDEYSFSFYDTSTPQPFGNTRAYHLKLYQKRPKVGFKSMDLWVSETGLILQSNGVSPNGIDVSLTFSDIKINTEMPDYIFEFEVPADAQIMRNTIVPFSD
jgi:outer membrane lipoprotein-sorting protein